jgi:hypothetical protein
MVLAQFIILPTTNNRHQTIGIQGKCSIRVLGIQYHDTAAAATSRVIQIQSDALYFPYSPAKYITFISNNAGQMNYDNSRNEYHLQNTVLNGQIFLYIVDTATGQTPGNFSSCVLTLDIEKLDKEFS